MGSRATAIMMACTMMWWETKFRAGEGGDKGLNKGRGTGFLARQKHRQAVSL
jgi:hypothetical protein